MYFFRGSGFSQHSLLHRENFGADDRILPLLFLLLLPSVRAREKKRCLCFSRGNEFLARGTFCILGQIACLSTLLVVQVMASTPLPLEFRWLMQGENFRSKVCSEFACVV